MKLSSSQEKKIKQFIPKHEPSSVFMWVFQRLTGVLLFFILLFHMLINHLLTPLVPTAIAETSGVASFEAVAWKMNVPLYFMLSVGMVVIILFHMLNGFRTIILDLAPGKTSRKLLKYVLLLVGVLAIVFVVWINLTVASFG